MFDSTYISMIEIDLVDRSTHSCDDIILREAGLEIGISDHRSDDIGPDFSLLEREGYFDILISLTCEHRVDDDPCRSSEPSDTMIWPENIRDSICIGFDDIVYGEYIVFTLTEYDRIIATDDLRSSAHDSE